MMLIINPHSGRGLSRLALGSIVSRLCYADYSVTVYFVNDRTPEELAYNNAKNHDLAVCVGGDGTLSGVISGLLKADHVIPVGYIPAGTANDVATTLTLSRDPSVAARSIIRGSPRPIDIGKFNDRYFTYITAFGAFTEASYLTPHNTKRSLGHFAYILGGLADMAAIRPRYTVIEYDGKVIQGNFIFGGVMNSTSIAGIVRLDPKLVDLADGLFEIILVRQPLDLAAFLDIMSSLAAQTYNGDNVKMLKASKVRFTFKEDVAWTVDGEDGGKHREVQIVNCHKAIEIVM